MSDLIEVNCAACDKVLEIFEDAEGFDCPYCGASNVFVDEDEEEETIESVMATMDDPLVLGQSIITSWCGRHEEILEHAWAKDRIIGVRLFCLSCWPSQRPKYPIIHVRREK